jgi:hypothetical protein
MERLRNGQPGPHECWRELAEHSLTHDDLVIPAAEDAGLSVAEVIARLNGGSDHDRL